MKKLLIILFAVILFCGCSESPVEPIKLPLIEQYENYLLGEYWQLNDYSSDFGYYLHFDSNKRGVIIVVCYDYLQEELRFLYSWQIIKDQHFDRIILLIKVDRSPDENHLKIVKLTKNIMILDDPRGEKTYHKQSSYN